MMELRMVNTTLDAYLRSSRVIDWMNQSVLQKSNLICQGLSGNEARIEALYCWVRDNIVHSRDADLGIIENPHDHLTEDILDTLPYTASQVLEAGHGICYGQSHLLAALLRAQKIPAGLCYQVVRRDHPRKNRVLHGLNAVYVAERGHWQLLDARIAGSGAADCFTLDRPVLAFPMQEAMGEYLYPEIYDEPHTLVSEMFERFQSRRAMWPYLPDTL